MDDDLRIKHAKRLSNRVFLMVIVTLATLAFAVTTIAVIVLLGTSLLND